MAKKALEELDDMDFGDMDFGDEDVAEDSVDIEESEDSKDDTDEDDEVHTDEEGEELDGDPNAGEIDDEDEDEESEDDDEDEDESDESEGDYSFEDDADEKADPKQVVKIKPPLKPAPAKKTASKKRASKGRTQQAENAAVIKGRKLDLNAHPVTGHLGALVQAKALKLGLSAKATSAALGINPTSLTTIYRGYNRTDIWCICPDAWQEDRTVKILEPGDEVYPDKPTIPSLGGRLEKRIKQFLSSDANVEIQELAAQYPQGTRGRPKKNTEAPTEALTEALNVLDTTEIQDGSITATDVAEAPTKEPKKVAPKVDTESLNGVATELAKKALKKALNEMVSKIVTNMINELVDDLISGSHK